MDEKNNSYYIPTIDEFHVGFEYEKLEYSVDITDIPNIHYEEVIRQIKTGNTSIPYKRDWVKKVFNASSYHRVMRLYSPFRGKDEPDDANTSLRVKYLDREDIESLGFMWDRHNTAPEWYFYKDKQYTLKWYTGANEGILIERNGMFIFYGSIKNKSELKVLLKQLNIC